MSYAPKPDVRQQILRAIRHGHRRMSAIYDFVMRENYNRLNFAGWSWVDLELYRMKKDGLVYYSQRSPGVRPGWYMTPP